MPAHLRGRLEVAAGRFRNSAIGADFAQARSSATRTLRGEANVRARTDAVVPVSHSVAPADRLRGVVTDTGPRHAHAGPAASGDIARKPGRTIRIVTAARDGLCRAIATACTRAAAAGVRRTRAGISASRIRRARCIGGARDGAAPRHGNFEHFDVAAFTCCSQEQGPNEEWPKGHGEDGCL
jgi:hypothetical protein